MVPRVVLIPRHGGTPDEPLVAAVAAGLGPRARLVQPAFLRPEAPRIDEWAPIARAQLWERPRETIFLGLGLGCRAALHALSALRPGIAVGGLVAVGGWHEPLPATMSAWDAPISGLERARSALGGRCVALLDAHAPTAEADAGRWETLLGGQVRRVSGPPGAEEVLAAATVLLDRM